MSSVPTRVETWPGSLACCSVVIFANAKFQDALEALRDEVAVAKGGRGGAGSGASGKPTHQKHTPQLHSLATCRSCGTTPIYGNLYRCIFCKVRFAWCCCCAEFGWGHHPFVLQSGYDLCARCFHRQRHSEHLFVFKEKPRMPWKPAVRQGDADGALPAELAALQVRAFLVRGIACSVPVTCRQEREFSDADYELLLSLESRSRGPTLPMFLAKALPVPSSWDSTQTCCACGCLFAAASVVGSPLLVEEEPREMGCGHVVHTVCAAHLACSILEHYCVCRGASWTWLFEVHGYALLGMLLAYFPD